MNATAPPPAAPDAFDALAAALARGDDVDAELVVAVVAAHNRTMGELTAAVAALVAVEG